MTPHSQLSSAQLSSAQLSSAQCRALSVVSMASPYIRHLKNQDGQSLIQTLIGIGIMGIMMMAFASMTTSQARDNRGLTEKLAATDLTRVISLTLSQASTCNLLFTTASNVVTGSSLTFDPSTVTYPFLINLNSIPQASSVNVISLAQPLASDLSNTLRVQANTGIQVQVTSATTAKLLINFDQTNLVRPIHNLAFPISIVTIPSGSNQQINGCQSGGGGTYGTTCPTGTVQTGTLSDGTTAVCSVLLSNPNLPPGTPCSVSWYNGVTANATAGRCCLGGGGGSGNAY